MRPSQRRLAAMAAGLSALALALAFARPALASWPTDSFLGGLPLCTVAGTQQNLSTVSDGAGGAIVAWQDHRGASDDIYVQRVGLMGDVLSTSGGLAVCTATGDQQYPKVVSDGAGGAIVTWQDQRTGGWDLYAQHVLANGTVDPAWPANGRALSTAVGDQLLPNLVSDGAGGAIVTWYDSRNGGANTDIFAQRVSGAGTALWTANGVSVCGAPSYQDSPVIVSDGAGGAIISWEDARDFSNNGVEVFAQRLNASGAAQWTANGVLLSGWPGDQDGPVIAADGQGGAIVAWTDFRPGSTSDIYAQKVTAAGTLVWPTGGAPVIVAANSQNGPLLVSDGAGGAIFTWVDQSAVPGLNPTVWVQRLNGNGFPAWQASGVFPFTYTVYALDPAIVSDGAGGAVVSLSAYNWIYAQRFSAAGALLWGSGAVQLASLPVGLRTKTVAAPDGSGGAIVSFLDTRSGNLDVYAERVEHFGNLGAPEAVVAGVKDVRNDQGGAVKVSWKASYLDADPYFAISEYRVWRSVPSALLAAQLARGRRAASDASVAAAAGDLYLDVTTGYAWELVASVPGVTLPLYSVTAATTGDSTAAGNPLTAFMVEALEADVVGAARWFSMPDSGYSVDNLAPAAPAPFAGQYVAGTTSMTWGQSTEGDLAGYRLYRGKSPDFVPGPGNLVASIAALASTSYADAAGEPYDYKLTALDVHGNESAPATLVPAGVADAGPGPGVTELALAAPSPNPASRASVLRYALPRSAQVRLVVRDVSGRVVRVLDEGARPAGEHAVRWDFADGLGTAPGAGVFFVTLEAEGRALTRRLALVP